MTPITTVDVTIRVWDGGEHNRIYRGEGIVLFEEMEGFVVDYYVSMDELIGLARDVTWALTDDAGGRLTVAHVGWNQPWAVRDVEITLELVGIADDSKWRRLLDDVTNAVRQPLWDQLGATIEADDGSDTTTS